MAQYTPQDLIDNLNYLNETKQLIKSSIINKGQEIDDNDTFRSYADKIDNIATDTTATENDITINKSAYINGNKVIGTYDINDTYKNILYNYIINAVEGETIHIIDSGELPMILEPHGNVKQDTRDGYNLGLYDKETTIQNEVTFTHNEDGSMNINGTSNNYTTFALNKEPITLEAGTYTFAYIQDIATIGDIHFDIRNTLGNALMITYLNADLGNWKVKELVLEETTEVNYVYYISNGLSVNNQNFKFMLLKGTYTVEDLPEYEVFGKMPSTNFPSPIKNVEGDYKILNRNKNLFKAYQSSGSVVNNGITCEMLSYNKLKLNGTSTTESWIEIGSNFIAGTSESYSSKFINLDTTKKYKYQIKKINGNTSANVNIHLQILPKKGNRGLTISSTSDNPNVEVSDSDGIYRTWIYLPNGITCNNLIIEIQIEESETVSDIIEPQSQNLSLTLPENVKLYGKEDGFVYLTEEQAIELELNGEGWYVYNKWGEYVFTGNETIVVPVTPVSEGVKCYKIVLPKNFSNNYVKAACNRCSFLTDSSEWLNASDKTDIAVLSVAAEGPSMYWRVPEGEFPNVSAMSNYIKENETVIIYPLKKPAYTKIIDSTLISQLEALKKVFSHYPVTNIDSVSENENAPIYFNVTYFKIK